MIEVETLIDRLRRFHNVVLEGVSGTGKTYAAMKVASAWEEATGRKLGGQARGRFAITLHPSTAYEDFVEGLRPVPVQQEEPDDSPYEPPAVTLKLGQKTIQLDRGLRERDAVYFCEASGLTAGGGGGFAVRDGFFTRVCIEAVYNPRNDYLVLLDELNRANVPKVLGDLLTTLEASQRAKCVADKQSESWNLDHIQSVTLPYSGRLFFVPGNVYLLATMNTNDYSVAPLDVALRRRFAFVRLEPLTQEQLNAELEGVGAPPDTPMLRKSVETWDSLNQRVLRPCLGPDAVLGHTYFFAALEKQPTVQAKQATDHDETINLLDALTTRKDTSGNDVTSAFWIQTGAMTGGSANQLDLSRGGVKHADWGMVHLFLGSNPNRHNEYPVILRMNHLLYDHPPSKILFPPGDSSNQTWRLQMNGGTEDGSAFTQHTNAGQLREKVLSFCELSDDTFRIRVHPLSEINVFQQLSQRHDVTSTAASGRAYGEFSLNNTSVQKMNRAICLMWQHQLLPQLIETVSMHGAQPLLDPSTRGEWLANRPELDQEANTGAVDTLSQFDDFLEKIGLKITIEGSGLGRSVHVQGVNASLPGTANHTHIEGNQSAPVQSEGPE